MLTLITVSIFSKLQSRYGKGSYVLEKEIKLLRIHNHIVTIKADKTNVLLIYRKEHETKNQNYNSKEFPVF